MRCPQCKTKNDRSANRCVACGVALVPRPARRRNQTDEFVNAFVGPFDPANLPALRAYWVALVGVIPFVGLMLGPLALLLGLSARRQSRRAPQFTAYGPLRAALLLSVAVTLTNWAGVLMMYFGWRTA